MKNTEVTMELAASELTLRIARRDHLLVLETYKDNLVYDVIKLEWDEALAVSQALRLMRGDVT